jgi:mRNA interferase YafQ
MRTIEHTKLFKPDYRREKRGRYRNLDKLITDAIDLLAVDAVLPARYRDHGLTGKWAGYRDCHLKPDLVLIYRYLPDVLQLVRLGSHSELFD